MIDPLINKNEDGNVSFCVITEYIEATVKFFSVNNINDKNIIDVEYSKRLCKRIIGD